LVGLIRHAETLISLQWYVSVLTLRLAVYTLFGKARSNFAKIFCIPKNINSRTLMIDRLYKNPKSLENNRKNAKKQTTEIKRIANTKIQPR